MRRYGYTKVDDEYISPMAISYKAVVIERMFDVLDILPKENQLQEYEVIFLFDEIMVTEGSINKENGKGRIFGFNASSKMWQEQIVDVTAQMFVLGFSYGNIIIDEDGHAIGAKRRPFRK